MKKGKNNFLLWVLIFIVIYFFSTFFENQNTGYKKISFSEFVTNLDNKEIKLVELK